MRIILIILFGINSCFAFGQNRMVVLDTLGVDSLVMTYYHNGQLFYQIPYSKGRQNGKSIQFHENGELWGITEYEDGKIVDGYYEFYYDNGKVHERGYYKNGKLSGTWEILNNNGEIWIKRIYNRKGEWVSQKEWSEEKEKFIKTGLY